jgi:hypothetical protein
LSRVSQLTYKSQPPTSHPIGLATRRVLVPTPPVNQGERRDPFHPTLALTGCARLSTFVTPSTSPGSYHVKGGEVASPPFQPVDGIPPFQPIAAHTFSLGPELVAWGPTDQYLFAFAVGTDHALWYSLLDGYADPNVSVTPATWSSWRSLGGVVMSPPCAVRSGEVSVDVFAAGADSELLHWQLRNGNWVTHPPVSDPAPGVEHQALDLVIDPGGPPHGAPPGGVAYTRYWESLGGVLTSPPHAVMFGELDDEILVFARGTDQARWSRTFADGTWGSWTSLGHVLASPPHAVVAAKETLAVFALGTDSAIWVTMGGGWQSLGGTFSSAPYAIAQNKKIHVFAADEHRALAWREWDGNQWASWRSLGGILMSQPIADCPSRGLPYVFALGTDSGVWRIRSLGGDWSDWESLGVGLLSLPATTARTVDEGLLVIVRSLAALGLDHQVWFQEDDY